MWFLAAIFYGYEFFQRVAPTIMATPIMNTFHLNHASFALVSSLYLYAYALAQLPAGALLDKYGPKICLSLSALGVALGTLLFSETENLLFLGLGRILIGIGSAFAFIGCLKLATQWFEGKTFGLIVGLTNLIGVLGALVGEAPLAELVDHYGWINSLKFSGFLGLFIALILFLFIQNTPSQSLEKKAPIPLWPCFKKLIKTPQNWLIGIYAGLMVSPVIAFTELWAVPFLQTAHHLNSVKAAAVHFYRDCDWRTDPRAVGSKTGIPKTHHGVLSVDGRVEFMWNYLLGYCPPRLNGSHVYIRIFNQQHVVILRAGYGMALQRTERHDDCLYEPLHYVDWSSFSKPDW
jgi:sugar phosphate permease